MTGISEASLRIRVTSAARSGFEWLRRNSFVWSSSLFLAALAIFVAFQASIIPGMGLWLDELFSLWAGDPRTPFPEAFATRILPDTNGPIYFSLVHLVQQVGITGRAALIVLNFSLVGVCLALMLVRGWRSGLMATALSSVAIVLVTAPLLIYAPEGRVYGPVMALCALIAFEACRTLAGVNVKKNDLILAGALGVLAAWMHLFAALFAGSLATALIITGWLVMRRRDVVVLGLVFGASTSIALLVWLAFAFPLFTNTTSWIHFDAQWIFDAVWTIKQYLVGPIVGALVGVAFVGSSILPRHSRAAALALAITGFLFVAIPLAISFKMPIFLARYLLVASSGLLVMCVFLLRSHLVADGAPRLWRYGPGTLGALFFLFPILQGLPTASTEFATRPAWRGQDVIVPAVGQCPAGEIRVYSSVQVVFAFDYLLQGKLKPVFSPEAPMRDVAGIDCPVYGWAEHVMDDPSGLEWYDKIDTASLLNYFHLTNTTGVALEVIRHRGGVVLARAGRNAS